MEKEVYLRVLRRISTTVLVVLLLLFMSTPVLADEAGLQAAPETQETGLSEADFAPVAAQLEAVARGEGQKTADRLLYASLRATAPSAAPAVPEVSPAPKPASAQRAPVVVHAAQRNTWSPSGLLPFFVVVAAALAGLYAAVQHRRSWGARRTVYAPVHSRTFRG